MAHAPASAALPLRGALAVTLLAVLLRLPGVDRLPPAPEEVLHAPAWLEAWLGATPMAARLLPLLAALLALPLALATVARAVSPVHALAAAVLLATSPWHAHAARLANGESALHLACLAAALLLLPVGARRAASLAATGAALLVAIAAVLLHARLAPRASPPEAAPLLIGDLGLGTLALAALPWALRRPRAGARALSLLGFALLAATLAPFPLLRSAAPCAAVLTVAAALVLGDLLAATASLRARATLAALAVLPGLPALISEHLDAGRYELRPIAAALAQARRGTEAVYAELPDFAARELRVAARPLGQLLDAGAVAGAPQPAAPDAGSFALLLLDRGRLAGGGVLPPGFEADCELLARTAARRFDLRRYEARLYRRAPRR